MRHIWTISSQHTVLSMPSDTVHDRLTSSISLAGSASCNPHPAEDKVAVKEGSGGIPQVTPGVFSSLLKPLHTDVWWALLASLLVLSVVLRISLRFNHARAENKETVDDMTWGSCLLSSFMSVVGQGWVSTPDSLAARTVTISSWVLGILIHVIYTANLISDLTVFTVDRPIRSLQEFSARSDWKFAMEPGVSVLNDWKISRYQHERELFRRVDRHDRFIELDGTRESLRRGIQPQVLMYMESGRLYHSLGREACAAVPLWDDVPVTLPNFIVIAKGRGQMQRAVNQVMRTMNEAGMIWQMKAQWLNTGRSTCDTSAGFKELSFGDVLAVLVLVPFGMVSSGIILALEWVWPTLLKLLKLLLKKVKSSYHSRSQS